MYTPQTPCTRVVLSGLILILLAAIPLRLLNPSPLPLPFITRKANDTAKRGGKGCNIFRGNWVRSPNEPYYTNATCSLIFDQQNCMKFGRPDKEFLRWRWKPEGCELPLFDAFGFLELLRGKSMAFIGDSVGRNQAQSLLCLLATVNYPLDISETRDPRFRRWFYEDYNFTLASFWSPYLVKAINTHPRGPIHNRLVNLYLDEANNDWADEIEPFDYVIISAGRWFFGPQIYYEHRRIIGCHRCPTGYSPNLTMSYGYRRAVRTTFQALLTLRSFKGTTVLRTLSPAHFENGEWDSGGDCPRTRPAMRGEMKLKSDDMAMYLAQVEELRRAEVEGKKRGLRFVLLDTTEAMVLRPDGHPNRYGTKPKANGTVADCVHWCLPGPIDTWNELLLHMLSMEG